jgi:hypothetical protein
MQIDIKFYLGILAGVVSFVAYIIYFRSILKGHSKPNRITWWIWTFMGGVLALSYYASGARDTIWSPIVEFIGPFITALFSIKYGEGGVVDKTDVFCLAGGVLSIVLWILTGNPIVALMLNIAIDQFALIPTIKKSFLRPEGESFWAWAGTGMGDLLNILAIDKIVFSIIVYPVFMLIDDIIIVWLLRKEKRGK